MLLHMEGFSSYTRPGTAGGTTQIRDEIVAAGYGVLQAIWTIHSRRNAGPRGGVCVSLTPAGYAAYLGGMQRTYTSTADKIVIGFAFMLDVPPPVPNPVMFFGIGLFKMGTVGSTLFIDEGVETDYEFPAQTWVYVEVVVDKPTGEVSVFIDNTLVVTSTADVGDTFTYTLGCDTFTAPYGRPNGGEKWLFADHYVLDSSGSRNNDRLGPQQINPRLPTADASKTWVPSNGSATNYSVVGTANPSTSTFLSSTADGAADRYTSGDAVAGAEVNGVSVVMLARKTDTGAKVVRGVLADAESADVVLSQTFAKKFTVFNDPPAAGPLAVTEFGMKVATPA